MLQSRWYDQSSNLDKDMTSGDVTWHTRTQTLEFPSHCEVFISVCVSGWPKLCEAACEGWRNLGNRPQTSEQIVSQRTSKKKGVEHESSVSVRPRGT